jgi:hypothetical protein
VGAVTYAILYTRLIKYYGLLSVLISLGSIQPVSEVLFPFGASVRISGTLLPLPYAFMKCVGVTVLISSLNHLKEQNKIHFSVDWQREI